MKNGYEKIINEMLLALKERQKELQKESVAKPLWGSSILKNDRELSIIEIQVALLEKVIARAEEVNNLKE